MPNEIKIYKYIGIQTKKSDIPSSEFIDLAFATRKNKRLILLLSEHGLEEPGAPAVIVEYKCWDETFRGPYAQPGNVQPFRVHFPNGERWFIANEVTDINGLGLGIDKVFVIFKMA